jgi:phosphotransferase system IIB component
MLFLEFGIDDIAALVTLVPIFVLLIVATIIGVTKRIKMASKYKKGKNTFVNEELQKNLLEAFGNKENITEVGVEMSRVTVTVKDIELVKPEVIKENGSTGVLLVGNQVKCSFGDKAEEISKLLK